MSEKMKPSPSLNNNKNTTDNKQLISRQIQQHDLETWEVDGRIAVQNNEQLRDFATFMSHPEFVSFFDKYFKTWEDCQESILCLKTIQRFKEQFESITHNQLTGNQIAFILKQVLQDTTTRKSIIDEYKKFIETKTK